MAVSSSWFQNWNSPGSFFQDTNNFLTSPPKYKGYEFGNNYRHNYGNELSFTPGGTSPNMINFIPYLLSLGVIKAQTTHPEPPALEVTGPFKTWYYWSQVDFAYETPEERQCAIEDGDFVQENNLPLGIEIYKERIFVTLPKWKPGVPCTLAVIPRVPEEPSPILKPYPNWEWHTTESCYGLTSVFRIQTDHCGRLWVLDSGQIDVVQTPKQVCPPAIYIFDLNTDKLILRYELPKAFRKQDSLYTNILVDVRNDDCENTYAYLTDVWRFGLIVFHFKNQRSWRITDHLFYPDPLAAAYKRGDLEWEWRDGIFGMALSPLNPHTQDRLLYFHPMSSYREFFVKTSVIRNETGWSTVKDAFKVMGQSRGKGGQSAASAMDRNGILFFNLVTRDSVGCWDSRKPYKRENLGVAGYSNVTLDFPNDLKMDKETRQSVWIVSNRLPTYLYKKLDKNDINFRILTAYTDEAIKGTICDPTVSYPDTFEPVEDGDDCY